MQIGVQIIFRLGTIFNKCDSSHVLLFFVDALMSKFGKSIRNLVNIIWFTVNSNSISWVHLMLSGIPLAATGATFVDVLVSHLLILKEI